MHRRWLSISIVLLFALAGAGQSVRPSSNLSTHPAPVDFAASVKPIFAQHCYACHGPDKHKSDYRLDVDVSALRGGSIGGAIVPGDSASSLLMQYVTGSHPDIRMPPKGDLLPAADVALLRSWIDQGAKWEQSPTTAPTTQPVHWSLAALERPAVPAVKQKDWVRNPIDAFILAGLEAKGMTPSAKADRRTLIRRVTWDLIGLPPTPAEVDAFIADASPGAYERLVDRLLASPRYGERWARHWMDVVHYAETHGNDEDAPRPNAWPYRDYLIQSFNADKPYSRFVAEQLAGDVLYPDDPGAIVATAFNAVGPWDESSQMGIMDGTIDKQAARYLDRDDMLMTAISTFTSTTVHCARCHDHKFDPIPQTDYYALQAVFAGVDRVDRPYDANAAVASQRRQLLHQKTQLASGATPASALLAANVQARVAAWERERGGSAGMWSALHPTAFTSSNGATLTEQADGSILSGGPLPDKDTVTVAARSPVARLTAVRLEVLADASLPHGGPGRQPDNGNLHLSEFRAGITSAAGGATKWLEVAHATTDFDQDGWTIAMSIDGNSQTAWGIHPQEGKSHTAVFVLKTPVELGQGDLLTVSLAQLHGRGHIIGRARLSVTAAAAPSLTESLPSEVVAALAIAADHRSDSQRAILARHVLLESADRELAALPAQQRVYAIASDFPAQGNFKPAKTPRPVQVLRRGDVRLPMAEATAGALSCVPNLKSRFNLANDTDEGARRAALAEWVTDRQNVLTWRSIVNRVWHYHFGRGIVETPNDFGKMGARPTHPELLDWLAVEFRDGGGSIKRLHRLIVTSSTYRESSATDARWAAIDGENHLLWRMNRTRLDAEQARDGILAISGKLDLTMGGPSARQFGETPGPHVTPILDYSAVDLDSPAMCRRGVYRFVFRTVPDPLLRALDCPDASQLEPVRESSVTAIQALAMLNDRFVIRQSEQTAARLKEMNPEIEPQIDALFRLAMCRSPDAGERAAVAAYARKFGLANAVRMIFNCNEFMFVE